MPNYQNSKIYKIWSPQTDEIYVGSTTQPLSVRRAGHRRTMKRYKAGKTNYISSFKILEYGDARIELICECPCDNREQLRAIEGRYIRELNCCNKLIAGRTKKEYYESNKEAILAKKKEYHQENREAILAKMKEYHQKNKEVIRAKSKEYREANKEVIKVKKKEHYESNKEAILAKQKEYNQANREAILARYKIKVQCECGATITKCNLKRHQRSAKHKRLMDALTKGF